MPFLLDYRYSSLYIFRAIDGGWRSCWLIYIFLYADKNVGRIGNGVFKMDSVSDRIRGRLICDVLRGKEDWQGIDRVLGGTAEREGTIVVKKYVQR